MFRKVLIANRGAIACRILRTLKRMGVGSVAVYSDADRHSPHVREADEAVRLGPAPAGQSYLSIEAVLRAAQETGAEAVHPGYGFLSERAEFAEACEAAGLVFLGPTPAQMRTFALKHTARAMADDLGLPLLPGSGLLRDLEEAHQAAARIGYPVMLKSTAGGGGIGIRLCRTPGDLAEAFGPVQRLGAANFGDGGAFLEKFITRARHLEVQLFGDGLGGVVALGERDCSAQRRNQKVIEETPAPNITSETRALLQDAAVRLGQAVSYRSAGTVEFVYDSDQGAFYFLEMNTRLQVEHGVTEEVTGTDLVEWMVRLGAGDLPPLLSIPIVSRGHSIEARLYAEDAGRDFQPSSGRLTHVQFPPQVRVETWVEPGTEVTPYYDPMLAKVIVHAPTRPQALQALQAALGGTQLAGMETNLDYLRHVCASGEVQGGTVTTAFLSTFEYKRAALEVVTGGTQTTVQDWPGRLGVWNVGVPPSGPMDPLAFRLANRLVGNDASAAGLEMTLAGPTLRFGCEATIALTGAEMGASVDGVAVPRYQRVRVAAGSVLTVGMAHGPGMRAYLAVGGGLDCGRVSGQPERHSCWAALAGMTDAPCAQAMSCTCRTPKHMAKRVGRCCRLRSRRSTRTPGRSVSCMARTARRTSFRMPISLCCFRQTGRCTISPTGPACACWGPSRNGRGLMAARRACILPISTTMRMQLGRSTSRAICRLSSARTVPAWAALSALP